MSPWEVIGWAIAVPMVFFSSLFVFAVVMSIVQVTRKRKLGKPAQHPAGRHLRLVEDD